MNAPFCGCRSRKYLEWSFLGEPLCGNLRSRGGVRGVDGDFTAAAASASATGRRLPPGELPVVHGLRPSCDPLFFFLGDDAIFAGAAGPDRAESPCFAAEVAPAACLTFRGDLCCFLCDCTTRSSAQNQQAQGRGESRRCHGWQTGKNGKARQDNGSSCIGCEGLTGMDSAAGGSGWTCPKSTNRFSSRAAAAAFMLFKVSSFCSSLIISLPGVVCFPFFSSCPWTTNPSREAGALVLSIRSTTFKMWVSRHRHTLSRVSASPSHCPVCALKSTVLVKSHGMIRARLSVCCLCRLSAPTSGGAGEFGVHYWHPDRERYLSR